MTRSKKAARLECPRVTSILTSSSQISRATIPERDASNVTEEAVDSALQTLAMLAESVAIETTKGDIMSNALVDESHTEESAHVSPASTVDKKVMSSSTEAAHTGISFSVLHDFHQLCYVLTGFIE